MVKLTDIMIVSNITLSMRNNMYIISNKCVFEVCCVWRWMVTGLSKIIWVYHYLKIDGLSNLGVWVCGGHLIIEFSMACHYFKIDVVSMTVVITWFFNGFWHHLDKNGLSKPSVCIWGGHLIIEYDMGLAFFK